MPRWLWFSRSRVECIVKDAATCQTRNPYLLMIAVRGLCDGGFHTTEENKTLQGKLYYFPRQQILK